MSNELPFMTNPGVPILSAFVLYLNQYVLVSEEAKAFLTQYTRTITVPGNTKLVKAGGIAKDLFIVHSGGLRYHINWGKQMITPAIFLPGRIAPHPMDVYYDLPLLHDLRSIQPSLLSMIGQDYLIHAIKYFPELRKALPSVLLDVKRSHTERELWEKWTPEKKLSFFVEQYPQFYKIIRKKVLASYLGMAPETLSRLLSKKLDITNI